MSESGLLCFPKSFIVSGLAFRSLIHFEFIFVYSVRVCSNFILLYVAVQFPQHHLLKRLSFSTAYSCFLCHRFNGRMDKEEVVHIYDGILLSHKKEQNNAIFSEIGGSRDCQTEWSQTEKRQISYDIAYMWNLKNGPNELIYKTESHRCRKQSYGYQERRGERGINWEIGIDIFTLAYIK